MTRRLILLLRRLPLGRRATRALDETLRDWEADRRAAKSPGARAAAGARGVLSVASVLIAMLSHAALLDPDSNRPRIPLDRIRLDCRQAWRSLSVHRGSATATLLVFGLGIGLVTAMFALTDPFVLRPLPYGKPHELVTIRLAASSRGTGGALLGAPIPTVEELRARTDLFQGVAALGGQRQMRLNLDSGAIAFNVRDVTDDLFDVLGVAVARSGAWTVVESEYHISVLLTPQGRQVLAGLAAGSVVSAVQDTALAARTASGALSLQVAGGLPEAFLMPVSGATTRLHALAPFRPGALLTVTGTADGRSMSTSNPLTAIARLQPGVTAEAVGRAFERPLPTGQSLQITVEPLGEEMVGTLRPLAFGALGAAVLILLVCAGNVANLFIARGIYRGREFATRRALGASGRDLVRLWIVEVGALTAAAVTLGMAIASAALAAIGRVIPAEYVTLGAPEVTIRVAGFALVAGLAVAAVALVPGAIVSAAHARTRSESPPASSGRSVRLVRFVFATSQAALAMVLAVGAAMLVQSYAGLMSRDVGYDTAAVAADVTYASALDDAAFERAVEQSLHVLQRVPGVQAAAMSAGRLPGAWGQIMVTVGGERKLTVLARVSERFFDAVGLAIVEGRPLQSGDQRWNGVVVNHTFASTHWPNRSALGQVVGYQATALQAVVVGVVRDGLAGLTREPDPRVYELFAAEAGGRSPARDRSISYIVRASGEPLAYRESIRRAIARDGSQAVLGEISTLGSRLSDAVRDRTFATLVLSLFGFAGAAVTLAGLVGIVTFVVARRTRELAIRLAIGASTAHVRGLVAREAVAAALAGGFAGLVAGRWLSTWLEHLVYGIEAGNWTTTSAAGAAMLTLMIAAALIPARRAMRLQPTDALRVE